MFARYVWIIAPLFVAGCGGGINILPEPFTRERADGKIPVKVELIREQVRAELDGMPEGEAEVLRWQAIEKDYNECRLSSARATKSQAEEVFAVCMSQRNYVYMLPIDAEQFHNDIFFAMRAKKEESDRLAEERRIARKKKQEEERIAREKRREKERKESERRAEERRIADERRREERRIAAEKERIATEKKAEKERIAAEKAKNEKRYNPSLLAATNAGNLELTRKWLSAGANPNAKDNDGEPALHSAARGYSEIVKMLLSAGADPNAKDEYGDTALIRAAAGGHSEIVKMLLSAGADLNAANRWGWTALSSASSSETGNSEIVKMLLAAGADPNAGIDYGSSALFGAAAGGHSEIVKMLLSAGANPNVDSMLRFRETRVIGGGDQTPLLEAVRGGHSKVVKMLLAAGADIGNNVVESAGYRAHSGILKLLLAEWTGNTDRLLIRSAGVGQYQNVKVLLAAGANPNALTINPYYDDNKEKAVAITPLLAATQDLRDEDDKNRRGGYPEVVKMLLSAGADTETKGEYGYTAFDWAVKNGNTEIVKILLSAGADIMNHGNSVLIRAAGTEIAESAEIVKLLLEAGANVNVRYKYGGIFDGTPLHYAAYNANVEVVKLLLEAGANPNTEKKGAGWDDLLDEVPGHTPLMQVGMGYIYDYDKDKKNEFVEVVKLLLSAGADPNAARDDGKTALDFAKEINFSEMVRILQAAGAR